MKKLLLGTICSFTFLSSAQINYTVDVLRLKAYADDCDGGAPFCLNAPQDPIFNMWVTDGGGNENTACWIFEDDNAADYGLWIDIQNLEIANETNVNTSYINIEMSGFETDALFAASCASGSGDDAVEPRQLAQQFTLASIPMSTPYVTEVNIANIYYAEIQIEWLDITASLMQKDFNFSMSPNPAKEVVNFKLQNANFYSMEIMDLSGRTVLNNTIHNGSEVSVSSLENGIYIVVLKDEFMNIQGSQQLIIQ